MVSIFGRATVFALSLTASQFAFSVCNTAQTAAVPFGGGNGSNNNPYSICSVEQFNRISADPNYLNKSFRLDRNLNFAGKQLVEIGTEATPFMGRFNGNDKTISNVTFGPFEGFDVGYHGLFRAARYPATITNLNLNNFAMANVYGYVLGSLLGHGVGVKISDIQATNIALPGRDYTGGIVGWLEGYDDGSTTTGHCQDNTRGQISGSSAHGMIYESGTADGVGGLVGVLMGSDVSCSSAVFTTSFVPGVTWGASCVGGLLGVAYDSRISNVTAGGLITFAIDGNGNYIEPGQNNYAKGFGKVLGCSSQSSLRQAQSNTILHVDNAQYVGGLIGWTM